MMISVSERTTKIVETRSGQPYLSKKHCLFRCDELPDQFLESFTFDRTGCGQLIAKNPITNGVYVGAIDDPAGLMDQ